jgi:hypothetical protein
MPDTQPGDDDLPVNEAYNKSPDEVETEFSDEVVEEAIKEGPGYPDEVEEAWEELGSMEGDAPTS